MVLLFNVHLFAYFAGPAETTARVTSTSSLFLEENVPPLSAHRLQVPRRHFVVQLSILDDTQTLPLFPLVDSFVVTARVCVESLLTVSGGDCESAAPPKKKLDNQES